MLVVVTVVVVVVTLMVVTLVVVALVVVAERRARGHDGFEVDGRTVAVGHRGLLKHLGQSLAPGDLADHRGDLTLRVDGLGELVGVHAVLLGRHEQVFDELGLLDADLFLLDDGVEEELRGQALAGLGVDLGAVLVVLKAPSPSGWLWTSSLTTPSGIGISTAANRASITLSRACMP